VHWRGAGDYVAARRPAPGEGEEVTPPALQQRYGPRSQHALKLLSAYAGHMLGARSFRCSFKRFRFCFNFYSAGEFRSLAYSASGQGPSSVRAGHPTRSSVAFPQGNTALDRVGVTARGGPGQQGQTRRVHCCLDAPVRQFRSLAYRPRRLYLYSVVVPSRRELLSPRGEAPPTRRGTRKSVFKLLLMPPFGRNPKRFRPRGSASRETSASLSGTIVT
jgi:hypothetical protein